MTTKAKRRRWLSLRMPAKYSLPLHVCLLLLCIIGTIMLLSVSSQDATTDPLGSFKTLFRQGVFFVLGYASMLFLARNFTIERAKKYSFWVMAAGIFGLILTYFFPNSYGIRAWITIPTPNPLPNFTIQPSELTKLFTIVFLSVYWGSCSKRIRYTLKDILQIPGMMVGIAGILILKQPDFGSFAILGFLVMVLILLPTHPVFKNIQKTVYILIAVVGCFAFFLMTPLGISILHHIPFFSGFQIQRFELALNPFVSNRDEGYQLVNGLVAFYTGGWFGVGLGNSTHKYGYVPAAKTDSILPIIVEETGVAGFFVIVFLYGTILYQLFRYAFKIKNVTARMILVGIASYFFIHFALNVGGVTGLIPMTGIPLVFISMGGSSTLTGMMAIGVAQAIISRYHKGEIE